MTKKREVLITAYFTWAAVQFILLITGSYCRSWNFQDFNGHADAYGLVFPFFPEIKVYDLTEFFFYLWAPVLIYGFGKIVENLSPQE